MAGKRVSLHDWHRALPFATDKISVRNITLTVNAGYDAWGRAKPQPVAISAALSLVNRTSSAASSDTVDSSTVHYGTLSKSIIAKLQHLNEHWSKPEEIAYAVVEVALDVTPPDAALVGVEVDVRYTKSTHFGDGLSVLFHLSPSQDASTTPTTSCEVLHLDRLQIPALVGVNSVERDMKQRLVVSVWIDRVNPGIFAHCFEVEQLIFKTIEESAYETLEALGEELAARVIKYFILAYQTALSGFPEVAGIRVRLEKPSAVPAAEAPAVEIYRCAESSHAFGRRMITELGSKRPLIPFPLRSGLNDFLENWKLD